MRKKVWIALLCGLFIALLGCSAFAATDKAEAPTAGGSFNAPKRLDAGVYYYLNDDLPEYQSGGGRFGWYSFTAPEDGEYYIYKKPINESFVVGLYDRYE